MKFNFKDKEFGWSELIALGAFVLSGTGLFYTINANKANVIQGSGFAYVDVYATPEACFLVASIPIEYQNSGKTAVTLDKFTVADNKPVKFVLGQQELNDADVQYQTYLTPYALNWHTPKWLDKLSVNSIPFKENLGLYNSVLIAQNAKFSSNFAVVVALPKPQEKFADFITVEFDTHFSNGQVTEFSSVLPMPKQKKCNG